MSSPLPFWKYMLYFLAFTAILAVCSLGIAIFGVSMAGYSSSYDRTATYARPAIATPSPLPPTATPAPTALPPNCTIVDVARICVQGIIRSSLDTRVELKVWVETFRMDVDIFPDTSQALSLGLFDEQGRSYAWIGGDATGAYNETEHSYDYILAFEPAPASVKELSVSLPMVGITTRFGKSDTPPASDIRIDFGEHPQPGETKALDTTALIDGYAFHFVKAEFEGEDGYLWVTVYTDPLNLPHEILSIRALLGDPARNISFNAEPGSSETPYRMFGYLIVPSEKSSELTQDLYIIGAVDLKVTSITVSYRGPFELRYKFP